MSSINFAVRGQGNPVILIHGFPFHHRIWHSFAERLSNNCQVFTPDLPGFGESALPAPEFSIDSVAKRLIDWVGEIGVRNVIVVGHSMGGYVALSMVNQRPDLFSGLILFHSTALADSPEKKDNRNKVIEFIGSNGVKAFTANFIEPLFANKANSAINTVKQIAIQASADTVIGYTKAMRDRPDRQRVLKEFTKPILFIAGAHDGGIPFESIEKQAALSSHISYEKMNESAHMGMFEETDKCLSIIKNFAASSNQPFV